MLLIFSYDYIYNNAFLVTRWIGTCYHKVYAMHPSAQIKGLCMYEDCCYVGHLNTMSRHLDTKHSTPTNGGEMYLDVEECGVIDLTVQRGIDGREVGEGGEDIIENMETGDFEMEDLKRGGSKPAAKEAPKKGGDATKKAKKSARKSDGKKKVRAAKQADDKKETAAQKKARELAEEGRNVNYLSRRSKKDGGL